MMVLRKINNKTGLHDCSAIGVRERKESRVSGLVRFLGIRFPAWLCQSPRLGARRDMLGEDG